MSNIELDYSNTIIYKITCKDITVKDVYVGHTTNFVQRKNTHRRSCINHKSSNYNCKVYKAIRANGGWNNWVMEIINFFNCKDLYEARIKEQEYFVLLNANLNSIEPLPTHRQKELILSSNIVIPTETELIFCSTCDIHFHNKILFDNHVTSKKHIKNINNNEDMLNPLLSKNDHKFICECCNYKCDKRSNYNDHLTTHKHKININKDSGDKPNVLLMCKKCNKQYNSRPGLWYHTQKCKVVPKSSNASSSSEMKCIQDSISNLQNQNIELLQEILELKKYIVEINNYITTNK
jgi:hypothetical protein